MIRVSRDQSTGQSIGHLLGGCKWLLSELLDLLFDCGSPGTKSMQIGCMRIAWRCIAIH